MCLDVDADTWRYGDVSHGRGRADMDIIISQMSKLRGIKLPVHSNWSGRLASVTRCGSYFVVSI